MNKPLGRPRTSESKLNRTPGANRRTAFYTTSELLDAIAACAKLEQTSNSAFVSKVLTLLLLSEAGRKLQELAIQRQQPLTQELTKILEFLMLSPVGQQVQQSAVDKQISLLQELQQRLNQTEVYLLEQDLAHLAQATFRSPTQLLIELVNLLLAEPIGPQLQENIVRHRRTLGQEVERNLILFREQIPTEEIINLAQATLRTPDEMLIRLVMLGLEEYKKRGIAEKE